MAKYNLFILLCCQFSFILFGADSLQKKSSPDKFYLLRLEVSENKISVESVKFMDGKIKTPRVILQRREHFHFKIIDVNGETLYENLFRDPRIHYTEDLRLNKTPDKKQVIYEQNITIIKIPFQKNIDRIDFSRIDRSTGKPLKFSSIKWTDIPNE